MDLKIKDLAVLLKVEDKTIYQWIKDKNIPCYKINHQYRFNKAEINEWILSHKTEFSSALINLIISDASNLSSLIEKGSIATDVKGKTREEVFKDALLKLSVPQDLTRDEIYKALMNREELMPTAIGSGIAVPHPRNPIVTNPINANVSICYLNNPLDYGALDNKPVSILFILLTASPKMHLNVLSKISYLCQDKLFLKLLEQKSEKDEIISYIKNKEEEWAGKRRS